MNWTNANVVITGASRGIGRAVATAAARSGARVGLIARSRPELETALAQVGGNGAIAIADVGNRDEIVGAIKSLEADLGPTDVLVANAGIGAHGPFAEIDPDEIDRLMRINYLGTAHAIRTVLPGMIERRRGHIVVVGSIAGRIGAPFEAAYSASKFAQSGLVEALDTELAPHRVGVSMVNPGIVETEFFNTRGVPHPDGPPKPISAAQVADAVIRAVDKGILEQVTPRWLRSALVIRHIAPGLLRWGTRRRFKST